MGVCLRASYEVEETLVGDRVAAREAVAYAFSVLGWQYELSDPDHFQVRFTMSGTSIGEILRVSIEVGRIVVKSQCISPIQLFDWGKNKQNVDAFLVHYSAKEIRDRRMRTSDPPNMDKLGRTKLERALREDEC